MDTFLWVLQWLLAMLMVFVGVSKTIRPYESLINDPRQGWANDFWPAVVKFIGVTEIAGALGLVLPGLAKTALVLTPLAAVGLVIIQLGAAATSRRRGENQVLVVNVVLLVVAAVVALGRFGPWPLA